MELISTDLRNAITKALGSKKFRLGAIDLVVLFVAFWHLTLVVLGKLRPCWRNGFMSVFSTFSFNVMPPIITYMLGIMQNSPFRTEFFSFWAIFLVYVTGSPDSFSINRIQDNEQQERAAHEYGVKIGALAVLLTFNTYPFWAFVMVGPIILVFVPILRIVGRLKSINRSRQSVIETAQKITLEYLTSESVVSGLRRADPDTMEGYNFLVSWRPVSIWKERWTKEAAAPTYQRQFSVPNSEVITIDEVWNSKEWLLSSRRGGGDPDSRLKDMVLSLSLFRLLILRYAQYRLPREAHERMWDLICRGALRDHKRCYRVIEAELALLFDFFYTDYASVFAIKFYRFTGSAIACIMSIALLYNLIRTIHTQDTAHMPKINGHDNNILVTYLVAGALLVSETAQLIFLLFSRWNKIVLILQYTTNERSYLRMRWLEKIVGWICSMPHPKPWERKLRQYSLLEYKRKEGYPITFPEEVMEHVLDLLTRNGRRLRNGTASLDRNKVSDQLGWACMLETPIHVILIWHVATSFCEFRLRDCRDLDDRCRKHMLVSLSLSGYLAYLIAFNPNLLPEHPCNTENIFYNVFMETRKIFDGCRTHDQSMGKLNEIMLEPGETVVNRGARLGKAILDELREPARVWKLLADFWAEMMVYVAPSDNFKAHLEEAAKGGQFVTHVWALLWHVGAERDEPSSLSPPISPGYPVEETEPSAMESDTAAIPKSLRKDKVIETTRPRRRLGNWHGRGDTAPRFVRTCRRDFMTQSYFEHSGQHDDLCKITMVKRKLRQSVRPALRACFRTRNNYVASDGAVNVIFLCN